MILEIFACDDKLVWTSSPRGRGLRDLGLAGETTIRRITDPASMVGRGVWRAPGWPSTERSCREAAALGGRIADLIRAAAG